MQNYNLNYLKCKENLNNKTTFKETSSKACDDKKSYARNDENFLLGGIKSVYFLPAALATLKPEFIDNIRATKKKDFSSIYRLLIIARRLRIIKTKN